MSQYTMFPNAIQPRFGGKKVTGTRDLFLSGFKFPAITQYAPRQLHSDIPPTTDIVLTFSEPMQAGTGNISLTPVAKCDAATGCTPSLQAQWPSGTPATG